MLQFITLARLGEFFSQFFTMWAAGVFLGFFFGFKEFLLPKEGTPQYTPDIPELKNFFRKGLRMLALAVGIGFFFNVFPGLYSSYIEAFGTNGIIGVSFLGAIHICWSFAFTWGWCSGRDGHVIPPWRIFSPGYYK